MKSIESSVWPSRNAVAAPPAAARGPVFALQPVAKGPYYVFHAKPGQTVRFWVVDAGPSFNTEFHVVGTLLDRAWLNADLRDAPQHGIQTAVVPAGGGGVFDVKIDRPGIYPFVSHSFASVMLGQVGLLKVGHVAGTMSH